MGRGFSERGSLPYVRERSLQKKQGLAGFLRIISKSGNGAVGVAENPRFILKPPAYFREEVLICRRNWLKWAESEAEL